MYWVKMRKSVCMREHLYQLRFRWQRDKGWEAYRGTSSEKREVEFQ